MKDGKASHRRDGCWEVRYRGLEAVGFHILLKRRSEAWRKERIYFSWRKRVILAQNSRQKPVWINRIEQEITKFAHAPLGPIDQNQLELKTRSSSFAVGHQHLPHGRHDRGGAL